jgi:hypothetical protein
MDGYRSKLGTQFSGWLTKTQTKICCFMSSVRGLAVVDVGNKHGMPTHNASKTQLEILSPTGMAFDGSWMKLWKLI